MLHNLRSSEWIVEINEQDTQSLKEAVLSNNLPHTTGFFFGKSQPEHKLETLEFIALAETFWKLEKYVAVPKTLIYFSSW